MPLDIDSATGLLKDVRQVLSPHCDARPSGSLPELIVVHGISLPPGEFGGPWIDALFTGGLPPAAHPYFEAIRDARVAAHALVRRDGCVTQYVPFTQRAWHAGASEYCGRAGCNDFSIGIELEGIEGAGFDDAQYARLCELLTSLVGPAGCIDVAGHEHVSNGRKGDPGCGFDWGRTVAALGWPARCFPEGVITVT